MTTQVMFLALAAFAAVMVVVSAIRDKKRRNRANLDAVGWVPWDVLQIIFGILVVVSIVLAFKSG